MSLAKYIVLCPPFGKTGPIEKVGEINRSSYNDACMSVVRGVCEGEYPQGSFTVMARRPDEKNKYNMLDTLRK